MRNFLKTTTLSLVATTAIYAGGYKIPETSTNAVALGAANIAHNHNNADAAYYNPAKMVFMSDENHIEADVNYIGLDKVNYKGSVKGTPANESSESEEFIIPTMHYVSPKLGDKQARVGVSIVTPGGLSKRWKGAQGIQTAKEFTLKIVEINPTAAFKISDNLGFAVGLRAVYSSGIVKNSSIASRDMTGDNLNIGYNLAIAYQPLKALEIGVTYRSKVDLSEEGNAKLDIGNAKVYDGGASVTIPLPATLSLAAAYTFASATTIEVVYEKTYWSAYKTLDFNYVSSISPILVPAFDNPIPKYWKDTNTFRVGFTQELNELTLMAGLVIDESPVPNKTIGFELPDTDSTSVSLGGRYKINNKVDVGISGLYSMHKNRTISASDINDNGLVGTFSDGNILIMSAGLGYKF
jgi:long-chain fatty acid transport protein